MLMSVFLLTIMSLSVTALPLGLADLQNLFYQRNAQPEYFTSVSGVFVNGTSVVGETVHLIINQSVSLNNGNINSLVVWSSADGVVISSSNFTADYGNGRINMTDLYVQKVLFESINLTNLSVGGSLVSRSVWGIVANVNVAVMNRTSNVSINSNDWVFNYSNGRLLLVNDSSPYKNQIVVINYSFYNNTRTVLVNYSRNNKLAINCSPQSPNPTDAFVKSMQFVGLTGQKKVGLWKGNFVVNSTTGTQSGVNNIMGDGALVRNITGYDTVELASPVWSNNGGAFSLFVHDSAGAANNTDIVVNVVCGYRFR